MAHLMLQVSQLRTELVKAGDFVFYVCILVHCTVWLTAGANTCLWNDWVDGKSTLLGGVLISSWNRTGHSHWLIVSSEVVGWDEVYTGFAAGVVPRWSSNSSDYLLCVLHKLLGLF